MNPAALFLSFAEGVLADDTPRSPIELSTIHANALTSANPKRTRLLSLAVALAYLIPALWLLPDYGPTWDCTSGEYPFGDRLVAYLETGDSAFLDLTSIEPAPKFRSPHPNFDSARFKSSMVYPLGSMLSGLSCRFLWTATGWVPSLVAHNLVVVLFSAVLVFALVGFTARRFGSLAGVAAGALLVLSPRFFAHSFNNLKDGPECCLYTLSILAGYLALTRSSWRWWMLAGAATGLALAQKSNALFIPVQLALFFFAVRWTRAHRAKSVVRVSLKYFGLGAVAFAITYFVVSPPFWFDPFTAPVERFQEMLRAGNTLVSRPNSDRSWWSRVSFYAPLHVLITTPPTILLLAAIGVCRRELAVHMRIFLLIGVLVPVGRNMIPGMRNFDGVRHFIEYMPMLAVLASLGLVTITQWIGGLITGPALRAAVSAGVGTALVLPGLIAVIDTSPNGVAYFNSFVGGLAGAQQAGLRGATDYWGNSYWQGIDWLNREAEPNARLVVPIAEHVARASAPVKLRSDIKFFEIGESVDAAPIYVMYITRRELRTPFVEHVAEHFEPVFVIRTQGAPVLEVYRLTDDEASRAALALRDREHAGNQSVAKLATWLQAHPESNAEVLRVVGEFRKSSFERLLQELRPLFPEELQADLEAGLERLLFRKLQKSETAVE